MTVEECLRTGFRDSILRPFRDAVDRYRLIEPGDRIAVCVSGGKDSMLLAKLMQMLQMSGEIGFEPVYLVMDPGYSRENRRRIEENARRLGIPCTIFESDVFQVANAQERNPCFLCARMRRGKLYQQARDLGCGKIALGHHFNDVIETTVMAMLYGGQLQAMTPMLRSAHFPGMVLIRPLYLVREETTIAWKNMMGLDFLQCACRFTESSAHREGGSKRQEVKALLRRLRETDPLTEEHVFRGIHALDLDTMTAVKGGTSDA